MKHFVVAVRDRAMDAFLSPFIAPSEAAAVRAFADEVNRKDSPSNKHPEDYDLYHFGFWDDKTGMYETGVPQMISIGKDLFKRDRAALAAVN